MIILTDKQRGTRPILHNLNSKQCPSSDANCNNATLDVLLSDNHSQSIPRTRAFLQYLKTKKILQDSN